ncbi:ATP-dependent nuclease [Mycobacterium numidiamassiliense]|uniref:ATP-dependent nuclease n=1 Tax=Mycobacterium numidiamassiliense TaxID=1841861 RepID=UPI0013F68DF5|nr:AAA family ATPase [Mycobacterium numidiamassiliense]
MSVIEYVEVENFRSIRSAEITEVGDYVPLVGLNSSGKSNVLRALNLFFNGYLDEDRTPLSMTDDFSTHAPKGKKKLVSVTVGLRLNESFKVRGQEDFHGAHGISDLIFIKRMWGLGVDKTATIETLYFGPSMSEMVEATTEHTASVLAHIRAVRFVYIPNHARPADLIRSELAPLQSTLVSRLRSTKAYRESSVDELFDELKAMGERMFGDVSAAVSRGLPGLGIQPDLPVDFADLVFNLGVQASTVGDVARAPEFEGSGVQSLLLLHVLNLADRTHRASGFGWIQASIWAIEEPESFLHAGLRIQFATDLGKYAEDPKRQIFVTTHQDEFVRTSEFAWLTTKDPDTSLQRMPVREALVVSAKAAISTYSHPLFTFASDPIVIVEGAFDDIYLRAAIEQGNLKPRWRLISPKAAFGDDYTGDAIHQYLKYNKQVVASRPDAAPVVVLRDWEAKDSAKYEAVLGVHPYSACFTAPAALSNPALGESFVGIERFLPTDFVTSVVSITTLGRETGAADAPYSIKRPKLEAAKRRLANNAEQGDPVGPFMIGLASWIDTKIGEILSEVPSSAFL